MTVIAWDGGSLAVDNLACSGDLGLTLKKYKVLSDNLVVAWAGDHEQGLMLAKWYEEGQKIEDWPAFQRTKDWSRLVVAGDFGVGEYEKEPVLQTMEDKYQAWGTGAYFALGAMAMGADSEKAVEVANEFCVSCGKGVSVFHFKGDTK